MGRLGSTLVTLLQVDELRAHFIVDAPTTTLDATIQAQNPELIQQAQPNATHAGRIVESGTLHEVFGTRGLRALVPRLDRRKGERRIPIQGAPLGLGNLPPGCAFRKRCTYALDRCSMEAPSVSPIEGAANGQRVACWTAETVDYPIAGAAGEPHDV